jgi:hypothetical protein
VGADVDRSAGQRPVRRLQAWEGAGTGWSETFGGNAPDELNNDHHLTVVAADVDPATERIIGYLAGRDVPINAVFFRYFSDDGRAYLARTWLLDEVQAGPKGGKRKPGSKEAWNEQDWYASFGEESGIRDWTTLGPTASSLPAAVTGSRRP